MHAYEFPVAVKSYKLMLNCYTLFTLLTYFTVAYQEAACDAASVHFGRTIRMTGIHVVSATVCTPAASAPAEERGDIGDRKPRDLRPSVDDGDLYPARYWTRPRRTNDRRFAGYQYYEPDFYDNDKRSMRPM